MGFEEISLRESAKAGLYRKKKPSVAAAVATVAAAVATVAAAEEGSEIILPPTQHRRHR